MFRSASRLLPAILLFVVVNGSPAQIIPLPFKGRYPGGGIKEKGWFKHDDCTGLWKYYNEQGDLTKTIDWSTGTKTYFNNHWEPFDDLFNSILDRGDSLLHAHFDSAFVEEHIRWNPNWSAFYARMRGYNWFEETTEQPDRFLLRYDIELGGKWYPEMIEFELDQHGQVIDKWEQDVLGFADCGLAQGGCVFNVVPRKARRLARNEGLKECKGQYIQYLDWHRLDTTEGKWLGEYEWVVARQRSRTRSGNETELLFAGIVIDPWTGTIKKRITLHRRVLVEQNAAVDSGLVRDDR